MSKFLPAAARAVTLVERYRKPITWFGWLCFGLICLDYARFLDLPALVAVPVWLGAIASVLRWAVWEGLLKGRVTDVIDRERADPTS